MIVVQLVNVIMLESILKGSWLSLDTSLQLRFWECTDPKLYPKWTFACNRKNFKFVISDRRGGCLRYDCGLKGGGGGTGLEKVEYGP